MLLRILLVVCCGAVVASAQSLPVYEVARVTSSVNVDGKLDEKAWADAKPVGAFVPITVNGNEVMLSFT